MTLERQQDLGEKSVDEKGILRRENGLSEGMEVYNSMGQRGGTKSSGARSQKQ